MGAILSRALLPLALALSLACGQANVPTVTVGDSTFQVEVAGTPEERAQGLSGRDSLEPAAGMLFVFESGKGSSFWMKGMRFPIDFVWIGAGCTVVDTMPSAPQPAPGTPDAALAIYDSALPAAYTLEINAGAVAKLGIEAGDEVDFSGFSVDGGC